MTISETSNRRWKPEPWFDFSRGEYLLTGNGAITFSQPLGYAASGTPTLGANNKIVLKAYSDTTGVEACPGVALEKKLAASTYSSGEEIYVEDNTFRREISLLREGFIDMLYVSGASPAKYGTEISPHPSGCQERNTGSAWILGKIASEYAMTGTVVRVKIEPREPNNIT